MYGLTPMFMSSLANRIASLYAEFLLDKHEDPDYLLELTKEFGFEFDFEVSHFKSYIDINNVTESNNSRFIDYLADFLDCHSVLVEFDKERANIMSEEFNFIGVGLAYNKDSVCVVDIFFKSKVNINEITIDYNQNMLQVKGTMLDETKGVWAMRVLDKENIKKELMIISPQYINYNRENLQFTGLFEGADKVMQLMEKELFLDVWIRNKPENIPYQQAYTQKININGTDLGCRVILEELPNERQLNEERYDDAVDREKREDERKTREDERMKEFAEKERRNQGAGEIRSKYYNNSKENKIIEKNVDEEEEDEEDEKDSAKVRI